VQTVGGQSTVLGSHVETQQGVAPFGEPMHSAVQTLVAADESAETPSVHALSSEVQSGMADASTPGA
jgi:hypothetical protein